MGMFDNLITGSEKQSPVDALLKLLDKEDRDAKTILEMPHIKFLIQSRLLYNIKTHPDWSVMEIEEDLMIYYKDLKVSFKGLSWEKTVEGIKEMKPQLMDANIQENLRK